MHKHENYEAENDEKFFEFQEIECHFNEQSHLQPGEDNETNAKSTPIQHNNGGEDTQSYRLCWSSSTETDNPLISRC